MKIGEPKRPGYPIVEPVTPAEAPRNQTEQPSRQPSREGDTVEIEVEEQRWVLIDYDSKMKVEMRPMTYKQAKEFGITDEEWNRAQVVKN